MASHVIAHRSNWLKIAKIFLFNDSNLSFRRYEIPIEDKSFNLQSAPIRNVKWARNKGTRTLVIIRTSDDHGLMAIIVRCNRKTDQEQTKQWKSMSSSSMSNNKSTKKIVRFMINFVVDWNRKNETKNLYKIQLKQNDSIAIWYVYSVVHVNMCFRLLTIDGFFRFSPSFSCRRCCRCSRLHSKLLFISFVHFPFLILCFGRRRRRLKCFRDSDVASKFRFCSFAYIRWLRRDRP